ncbi:MAG: glycosyltransferase family 2 protein, partial [Spirochaetes bacterium]|nr:glycosyltransferase family 2 protein [Spirochaetota bacterium]
ERLTRNQDIEFNKRLMKKGGKTYLIPEIECCYYIRETYREITLNNFQNGLWVILTAVFTKNIRSLSLRHYIPLIFIMSLILPVIFSFFYFNLIYLSIISFIFYNFAIITESIKLCNKQTSFFNLIKAFYTLHFSYGTGSLVSFFYLLKKSIFNKKL